MKRRTTMLRQVIVAIAWLLISASLFFGCQNSTSTKDGVENTQSISFEHQVTIDHAIGFDVIYHEDWKELLLFRHYNDFIDTVRYALSSTNMQKEDFDESHTIQVPVKSIGALSTTQLGMFDVLDALNELKAIETQRYVHNKEIIARAEQGQITELAPAGKLNLETTIASGIEVLMGVGFPNSQNDDFQTLQNTGLPVILNADWQEKTLLGRAEWMKILAVLLNKEKEVNQIWSGIESEYQQVVEKVNIQSVDKPTTITGIINGDSWYVAGGDSFVNNVLNEISVHYPWGDSLVTGSIRLDFETVYEKGLDAPFWLAPGSAKTLDDIYQADSRFQDFRSYQAKNIYNIFGRYTPGGGNDYYESAIVAPHIVLKDMVKIFHPELLPEHQLVYYNKLK